MINMVMVYLPVVILKRGERHAVLIVARTYSP